MQHEVMPSHPLPGGARFLDALADGAGRLRLFLSGLPADAVLPQGLDDRREVGDGLMIAARAVPGAASFRLALAAGGGLTLPVAPDRTALLAGKRVLLLLRVAESPGQLADLLRWHAVSQRAEAALVVNRAPGDQGAAFAAALEAATGGALALVVADLALPSGQEAPPETHPFAAADAPGKDRMTQPAADRWRAPLGEAILYEWMKWRYLARARSVVSLEACDMLPAPSGLTVFERAEAQGMIALAGRRAYPWRARDPGQPRAADHVCRMFDGSGGSLRWACAPEQAGLERIWRQVRITGLRPAQALPFWRAMALRVAEPGGLPLAPKSSLVEDAGLLALSRALGGKPVRPPASALKAPALPAQTTAPRVAIVTTMKNEGPFILEWLAWHRAIGVSDFLIYTNDCSDGTDTFLQLLMAKGLVEWRDNPFRQTDLPPQHAALQAAEAEAAMQRADWGICMDVDEFINIRLGDGRLPTLFAAMEQAMPGANMIAMTWRLFGNAGIRRYDDRFVTAQFTRCAPELIRKPHQAWGFKTLFRNIEIYRKLGVHRPKGLKPDLWEQVKWLNGSGWAMPKEMFRNGWRSTTETYGYDWVQLNHYAVRSAESFLVKRDRGRVNHVDRDQGLNYWFRMNHNAAEDRSILARLPLLQAEWARLMADPEIAAAHAACVAAHRRRIAELQATPDYAAFHAELTSPRMERLCHLHQHFGSAVFSAGPGVIPADLPLDDLPADFRFAPDEGGAA